MVSALSSINSGIGGLHRDILELRNNLDVLQRQLASGKKSETYGGLGTDRLLVLSLQERIAVVESFTKTIDLAQIRLEAVQLHLDRVRTIASETRTDTFLPDYQTLNGNQTSTQISASVHLNESLALLNSDIAGRHLFSGRTVDVDPVVTSDELLNGIGAAAGFTQIVSERQQADLGASGLGRLTITNTSPTVSLAEDAAGHPFGMKLTSVTSTLTGTTVTGPAGAPAAIDVTFSATLPQPGQTIRATFTLPDGSLEDLELTATTTSPLGDNEFLIGVDENDTAANFDAALNTALQTFGATKLASASTAAAANDFFYYDSANPPQRVDGPPFDSAVALRNATTTDTVFWYQGDNEPGSPRTGAIARIDDNLDIAYGTRANETPLTTVVSRLAMLAVETFDETVATDQARYEALTGRVAADLNFTNQASVDDIITELGFKQRSLQNASERHTASQHVSLSLLQEKEGTDDYEVSAKILQLQTQIATSFETTALLSQLSLVNFL